jgi:hypothetical protein
MAEIFIPGIENHTGISINPEEIDFMHFQSYFNTHHNLQVQIRTGCLEDIDGLLELNKIWYKPNLSDINNGFLSIIYSPIYFETIINNYDLLVIIADYKLVGYILVNSIIETSHIDKVRTEYFEYRPDSKYNRIAYSYQILIGKPLHRTGFFHKAHSYLTWYYKTKYDILVSTVRKDNVTSINAHKKFGWKFIDTNNSYYIIDYHLHHQSVLNSQ